MDRQDVQRIVGGDYGPGHSAPATTDNQGTPLVSLSQGATHRDDHGAEQTRFAERGLKSAARRGLPNDFGMRHQDRMLIGAYREHSIRISPAAGAGLRINADLSTVYEIDAAGDVSLTLWAAAAPSDPDDPNLDYVRSVVVIIRRQPGAVINWPAGIIWPADISATAFDPPASARIDTYVLVHSLTFGWMGHVIQQGYA